MNNIRLMVCMVLFCASGWAQSVEFSARVIAVFDGDTVLVKRGKELVKIRLAEIDAPEKDQVFGETSKRSLSDMVLDKHVKIKSQAMDQYGRLVAYLNVGGMNVNAEQIRRGMAWEYSHFHSNKELIALQEEARQAPRGLWALNNPIPPWEWRKLHPNSIVDHALPAPLSNTAVAGAILPGAACGSKKYCSEMVSCEEARYYLKQCGIKTLDGNGDGVPCEKLCVPVAK
jgi:endonuclease YncB( thermonuclease family)